jgi:TPR repeat protein
VKSLRVVRWACLLTLPGAWLLAPGARAQTPTPAPTPSVTVSAQRAPGGDPSNVVAAKSKVLSRQFASSCGYMSTYSALDDDVMLGYLRGFNMETHPGSGVEVFSDLSPQGDVSNAALPARSVDSAVPPIADPNARSVVCGKADYAFAAGRNYIARKDTTLAQGFAAIGANDYPAALALFNTAWDKVGYEEAALMLGKMHLYGMGTPRDSAKAIAWFKKVTEARYDPVRDRLRFDPANPGALNERCEAAMTLAKIYLVGIGVAPDQAAARGWYAKAAGFGYMPAASALGQAYLSGKGAAHDVSKGLDLLSAAAEAGLVAAQLNLGKLYYTGADDVRQNLPLAGAWFAAAAKAGDAEAMYAAGRMVDLGEGVPVDQQRAIVYYKDAAVKGNPDAQSALATYFYTGQLVDKNLATARKLFGEAALRGQPDAMFNLGVMSALGEGGPKDVTMAYVWLSLAKAASVATAGAALKTVAPQLDAVQLARADAILKPPAKAAQAR